MGRGGEKGADGDEGPRAGSASGASVNARLLRAVGEGDRSGVRRLLMDESGAWLDEPECRGGDPEANAALAALLSPLGTGCVEEFDAFFGDMRRWLYGGWNSAHWAVATQNEAALAWALRGAGDPRGDGISLMDKEEDPSGPSARGGRGLRGALAVAAQMGDPRWLARVVEISAMAGEDAAELARRDR